MIVTGKLQKFEMYGMVTEEPEKNFSLKASL